MHECARGDGRRRRRGERRRRRRRRRDASRRRRDVFSSIASSRRHPLMRVASSPLTRFNRLIIVSRSYLSRANARNAPARARRRRRRGRARPWTPFRRIRSNPRERRRAWWICRSFVARASSVFARSFLGARSAASSRRPRTFARGDDRSLDRVDDAVSTTRARARDGSEARMKRNSLISNHPSDVPPLAPCARRASSRSLPIDRATLSRSFARSSIARLPRRLPTEREREARETNTYRLVAFAALKARTLPRTADCVMDAMVVRARECRQTTREVGDRSGAGIPHGGGTS